MKIKSILRKHNLGAEMNLKNYFSSSKIYPGFNVGWMNFNIEGDKNDKNINNSY